MKLHPLLGLAALLLPGSDKEELVLQSGTTYAIRGRGMTITFTLGADGRATAVVVRAGDNECTYEQDRP